MKKILLPLALLCTLAACKKDDAKTVSRTSLVVGSWKLNSMKITIPQLGALGQRDLLDTMATCSRDDMTEFIADYTVFQNDGANRCDTADSVRMYAGTWGLVNSEKDMQLSTSEFGNITLKIDELNSTTMHLTKDSVVDVFGTNYKGTIDVIFVK